MANLSVLANHASLLHEALSCLPDCCPSVSLQTSTTHNKLHPQQAPPTKAPPTTSSTNTQAADSSLTLQAVYLFLFCFVLKFISWAYTVLCLNVFLSPILWLIPSQVLGDLTLWPLYYSVQFSLRCGLLHCLIGCPSDQSINLPGKKLNCFVHSYLLSI